MISVIIPHKNSINLLQRCLDSIPLSDGIEVLIIDDNSDVEQHEWDEFAERNKHVRLFLTKEGKGAGYARNVGLQHAKGDWIVFSDADDYFYPKAFEEIEKYVDSHHDIDIAYFNYDSRDGVTNEIVKDRSIGLKRAVANHKVDVLRFLSYVPWGKIIKRELIESHHISFEEIEASNDIMFSTLVGFHAKKVGVLDEVLYCCTRNTNSLFYHQSADRIRTRVEATIRVNNFLTERGLIKYRMDPTTLILYFFPKHPRLFGWALLKSRYKGACLLYAKDLCIGTTRSLVKKYLPWKYRS